ncbi:MAG: alpha/beta hydrolase, partial [Mesobacillus sp.]|uniref:alpha/beta fold hydrolase n=1 Tax=Mesobacillus sp. TaxID=2675271 RepID=UPI003C3B44AA
MENWVQQIINTKRGEFEIFIKGSGEPVCVTHHYSEFNSSGDYFAETFTEMNKVILVNLREAGQSAKAEEPYQLSMIEAVLDLESIREALCLPSWNFAGHSTGGMLGVLYGIHF